MSDLELRALERQHVVYGWQPQRLAAPLLVTRAEGVNFWDSCGNQYLDLCSGQINVNVGYGHQAIIQAMKRQLDCLTYIAPGFATEPRVRLSSMVAKRCPGDLQYVFFSNSGSEAIENAIKIARAATGRLKIYSAWQSYHGATAGASAISGDPRRLFAEPVVPGVAKFHYAACYRCPFGQSAPPDCGFSCLASLERQIDHDGPETIAAIVLEPIVGTSGLYVPPVDFIKGIRKLCDEHGVLLIFDETMTGWGRTGRWFACEHFDVVPDILVTAKGITSGYVPLGVTVFTPAIREKFLDTAFVGGLTNEGHTLACAAGIANIEVYEQEGLIERSAALGEYLNKSLLELQAMHPSVGSVRGKGLFACLELSSDRERRIGIAGYRNARCTIAGEITSRMLQMGVFVVAKWDFIFVAPPLIISRTALTEAIEKLDKVLAYTDELVRC
ncbi:aminotransferase class III-fold pyridoxal phosphate-dependent enzyme [Bradyrhizobium oligotrophicum]|uniref:aminotransferase class III-fold pyridoxal phosphate-dependent enzyme n=1 Tax=Bradyrhizobium oligotrophicum TaxID=44255 RepID=UPI00034D815F|nr:aminotransferase class III-fold pyridoxal phosphate-dependent enzyme [Bradyrhizobium oligotrophicum]